MESQRGGSGLAQKYTKIKVGYIRIYLEQMSQHNEYQ